MLRLYAGRENIDKECFIYDRIAEEGGETFVLVPNQYTLVAEEQALKHLETDCLFNVEVLSMNRLGLRLLTEQGLESVPMLDKYGRFMLLTRLIREHMDDFDIFRRSAGRMSFTNMLSDFISEFKQQNCSLGDFAEMLAEGDESACTDTDGSEDRFTEDSAERDDTKEDGRIAKADPLLRAKLAELQGAVSAYEEAIAGKYTDSEDYIASYIEAIKSSRMIKDKNIWIYGYDSITPKFAEAMFELAAVCRSVNFIVNRSDFDLDEQMIGMLYAKSKETEWETRGLKIRLEEISPAYELPRSETIRRIERGLWNSRLSEREKTANKDFVPEDLTLVKATDPYAEAETAAAYIWHLIRDLGYRMRDIQIIANDEGSMQPVIRRVFEEYGLPVFADSTRDITDTPAVAFIVNLLWFAQYRGSSQYLFAMLKTGLAPYGEDLTEDLENYANSYHIKGSMWERDFKYGEENIGTDRFAALNEMRADIAKKIGLLDESLRYKKDGASKNAAIEKTPYAECDMTALRDKVSADKIIPIAEYSTVTLQNNTAVNEKIHAAENGTVALQDNTAANEKIHTAEPGTVERFVKWFREYLRDVWQLDQAVEDAANADEAAGLHDEAQRLVQSYRKAVELLDQIVEIMGDSEMDLADFTDIYVAGLTGVEVGVIPPAADGLSMGTMIRTRPRPIRAAVILGANEGTLPLSPSPEGLFSVDEKAWFRQAGFPLGALDDIKINEEKAAMYRMIAKPSEKLYISWAMTDVDGADKAPSELIESLRSLFPRIDSDGFILDDIVTAGWNSHEISGLADNKAFEKAQSADRMMTIANPESVDSKEHSTDRKIGNDNPGSQESTETKESRTDKEIKNAETGSSEGNGSRIDRELYYAESGFPDTLKKVFAGDLFNTAEESLRHLTDHIKDKNVTDYSDAQTMALLKWFNDNRHEQLQTMLRAAADNNDPRPLAGGIPAALFGRRDGSLVLSASSINSYFECPFKYYIDRGLKPKEERDFRSDPRSIGDAYHECLMGVARRLMGSDKEILARIRNSKISPDYGEKTADITASSGNNSNQEIGTSSAASDDPAIGEPEYADIERLVSEELDKIAASYNEGLFISAGSEQFRMSRIREICSAAAKAMAEQLAAESLENAEFEESFRRGGRFRPITMEINGTKVYVEGKIDRADYLTVRNSADPSAEGIGRTISDENSTLADSDNHNISQSAADINDPRRAERVRVIDYKTGSDRLDIWKMRNGYKMQLMIYMISATNGGPEPAGIFYFNIKDPIESADKLSDKRLAEVKKSDLSDSFRLKGSYIDEPGVLSAMPAEVLAGSRSAHSSMTREEYESLRNDVLDRIKETASGIMSGNIRIRPFKDGKRLVCNNCSYKPICMRDREYVRNTGWELPPEPKPDHEP